MLDRTVEQLFAGEDVRYRVPIYQRHYVWNETHWEHLWNDIEEKADSVLKANLTLKSKGLAATEADRPAPHFTGVIVTRTNEDGEIVIVDGQQRLTTFQIILCAIRDICEVEFPDDFDEMNILTAVNKLLQNPPHPTHESTPDKLYKLLPTEGPDREAYRDLVAGTPHDNGLLPEAYEWFKNKIGKIDGYIKDEIEGDVVNNYDKMVALSQTLLFYFKIVVMPLESVNYKAAKVFESLNGRGLTLTQFDLLRNNVFLRAGNDRNRLYEICWRDFNKEPLWLSEKVVDDFLQNFLEAKLNRKYKPNRSLFDLYQRSYLVNLRQELGVESGHEDNQTLVELEFEELQRYSRTYAEIVNCSNESPMWFYQLLKKELQITSWHPLILLLKTELGLSEKNEKKIFHILESYIVWYMLCYPEIQEWIRESHFRELRRSIVSLIRRSEGSTFEVIVSEILQILKRKKNKWPGNQQVREALHAAGHHWSRPLIKYILFKIESQKTDPKYTDTLLPDFSILNIEHVMPRGWEKAKNEDTDELYWPITETGESYYEKARGRDHYVESIGNLTLLKREANNLCGTNPFAGKKKVYRKYSRLSLTADIIYDNNNVEREKWDAKEIRKREEKLVTLLCQMWQSADAAR